MPSSIRARHGRHRTHLFLKEFRPAITSGKDKRHIAIKRKSIALLDINVLVSLFHPAHLHHESSHRWFARNRVRVSSNPRIPNSE